MAIIYKGGQWNFHIFKVLKSPKMHQLSGIGLNLFLDIFILEAFFARNFLMA